MDDLAGSLGQRGVARAQWQAVVPESVNVLPVSWTNCQSYEAACSVSFRMPNVDVLRTSLFAATVAMEVWFAPPVPTMNERRPRAVSRRPVAFCGANRS